MRKLRIQSPETGSLRILEAVSRRDKKRFVDFQYELYKNDKCFVPPLRTDMKRIITKKGNPLFKKGIFILFIAERNGHVAGRIIAGIDEELNNNKNKKEGYIALFECINDYTIAEALFQKAIGWLKDHGMILVKGPVSIDGGDDYRGILVKGFETPPVMMNTYNFPYYADFFEKFDFLKREDLFAYLYDAKSAAGGNRGKAVEYAMKRYGFRVDAVDFKNVEHEISDIKEILDKALPESWEDLIPPSIDSIREFATTYKRFAEPELIRIARTNEGAPIGFAVGLPNYNELLIGMKGRLFPFGFIKLLAGKKKIKSARVFILFVIPGFQKKGVSGSMFYKSFEWANKKGYTWGEGSTIGETNRSSRMDAERAGGLHYKTYRVYTKEI